MKRQIKWGNVLFNLTMAVLIGLGLQSVGMAAPVASLTGAAVFTSGFFVKTDGNPAFYMAIQKEIWEADIVGNLYKANPFMNYGFNADQYVLAGKVVHVPNAGAKPTIVKNRTSLPATITQRTDTDVTYALAEYTADPVVIPDADTVELSYDKRQSVTSEMQESLFETVGDWMLYDWFTGLATGGGSQVTGHIIRTTGADVLAHTPSGTGNRKKFVKENLKAAQTYMNKNNIPKTDRFAQLDSDSYAELMDDEDLKKRDGANGGEVNLKEGTVMKLYGFHIMEDRPTVLVFTNAATPVIKAPGAAGAATDNAGTLCWQKNCVERALGEVKFFEEQGKVDYYGDAYSALLRAGGRPRRTAGIVAIVQAAGS